MFAWFPRRASGGKSVEPTREEFARSRVTRIQQRACALASDEMLKNVILAEREHRRPEEWNTFLTTYACFVLWAIRQGLNSTLPLEAARPMLCQIRDSWIAQDWFDIEAFHAIWQQMLIVMPSEYRAGRYGGLMYPAVDVLMAANMAGYALDYDHSPAFGSHVQRAMQAIIEQAGVLASEGGSGQVYQ